MRDDDATNVLVETPRTAGAAENWVPAVNSPVDVTNEVVLPAIGTVKLGDANVGIGNNVGTPLNVGVAGIAGVEKKGDATVKTLFVLNCEATGKAVKPGPLKARATTATTVANIANEKRFLGSFITILPVRHKRVAQP